MDVVVSTRYPHQPPLWLHNNRNLTFAVQFRGFIISSLKGLKTIILHGS